MPRTVAALAGLFFLTHVVALPTTFADLDAINFALGVQYYDVATHQPHPPGYPVFIAATPIASRIAVDVFAAAMKTG